MSSSNYISQVSEGDTVMVIESGFIIIGKGRVARMTAQRFTVWMDEKDGDVLQFSRKTGKQVGGELYMVEYDSAIYEDAMAEASEAEATIEEPVSSYVYVTPDAAKTVSPEQVVEVTEERFVSEVQFARLNKNSSMEEYKREVARDDFYSERCKVTHVATLSPEQWDSFSFSLLVDFAWLAGTGGHDSTATGLPDVESFHELTAEQQEEWRAGAYRLVVEVQADGRETIYVDAQGYNYARYVGINGTVEQQKEPAQVAAKVEALAENLKHLDKPGRRDTPHYWWMATSHCVAFVVRGGWWARKAYNGRNKRMGNLGPYDMRVERELGAAVSMVRAGRFFEGQAIEVPQQSQAIRDGYCHWFPVALENTTYSDAIARHFTWMGHEGLRVTPGFVYGHRLSSKYDGRRYQDKEWAPNELWGNKAQVNRYFACKTY